MRDGDKSQRDAAVIGNGLYWINGVMADASGILPVYSEIYGLDYEGREHTSENSKIIEITDMVHALHADAIHVLDRGGDRSRIIDCFIKDKKPFVVRGQAQRSLRLHKDSGKSTNIKDIAKRTRTDHSYKSLRNGEWFNVGLRRVYYGETALWLVVSRRRRGGLSWYLTNVKGTRAKIMDTVMEAYGLRWKVEEYHRQIKQDYGLEKICLRNYNAIKNMGVMVMRAASLLACLPKSLFTKIVAVTNMLPRKRISDMPDYPYYMITAAVAWILGQTQKQRHKPLRIRKRDYFQLNLDLRGF